MNILTSRTKQHTLASFCVLTIALSFAATQLAILGEVAQLRSSDADTSRAIAGQPAHARAPPTSAGGDFTARA